MGAAEEVGSVVILSIVAVGSEKERWRICVFGMSLGSRGVDKEWSEVERCVGYIREQVEVVECRSPHWRQWSSSVSDESFSYRCCLGGS